MFPKIMTEDGISTVVEGRPYSVRADHPNFDVLNKAIHEGDVETFYENYSVEDAVENAFEDTELRIENGELYFKDEPEPLNNVLADRIIDLVQDGEDADSMIRFLDNLLDNPSNRAVEELYDFLAHKGMPITEDGCFVAYKTIRDNWHDVYSNSVDNSVGNVIEMRRSKVDDDASRTCSVGYHVGAWDYAGFGGWYNKPNHRVVLVKVNPKDAVSVPADHEAQKLRVCRYEVLEELKDESGPLSVSKYGSKFEPEDDGSCDDCDCQTLHTQPDHAMLGPVMHFANALKKRDPKHTYEIGNELTDVADKHNVDRSDLRKTLSKLYDGRLRNERMFTEKVFEVGSADFGDKLKEVLD